MPRERKNSRVGAAVQNHHRDWLAIRQQYEQGAVGLRKLARLLGISESTMMQRSMREGWIQASKLVKKSIRELEADVNNRVRRKIQEEIQPWIEREKRSHIKSQVRRSKRALHRLDSLACASDPLEPKDEAYVAKSVETYDIITRRNLGMTDGSTPAGQFTVNVLANHSAVQVVTPDSQD